MRTDYGRIQPSSYISVGDSKTSELTLLSLKLFHWGIRTILLTCTTKDYSCHQLCPKITSSWNVIKKNATSGVAVIWGTLNQVAFPYMMKGFGTIAMILDLLIFLRNNSNYKHDDHDDVFVKSDYWLSNTFSVLVLWILTNRGKK